MDFINNSTVALPPLVYCEDQSQHDELSYQVRYDYLSLRSLWNYACAGFEEAQYGQQRVLGIWQQGWNIIMQSPSWKTTTAIIAAVEYLRVNKSGQVIIITRDHSEHNTLGQEINLIGVDEGGVFYSFQTAEEILQTQTIVEKQFVPPTILLTTLTDLLQLLERRCYSIAQVTALMIDDLDLLLASSDHRSNLATLSEYVRSANVNKNSDCTNTIQFLFTGVQFEKEDLLFVHSFFVPLQDSDDTTKQRWIRLCQESHYLTLAYCKHFVVTIDWVKDVSDMEIVWRAKYELFQDMWKECIKTDVMVVFFHDHNSLKTFYSLLQDNDDSKHIAEVTHALDETKDAMGRREQLKAFFRSNTGIRLLLVTDDTYIPTDYLYSFHVTINMDIPPTSLAFLLRNRMTTSQFGRKRSTITLATSMEEVKLLEKYIEEYDGSSLDVLYLNFGDNL